VQGAGCREQDRKDHYPPNFLDESFRDHKRGNIFGSTVRFLPTLSDWLKMGVGNFFFRNSAIVLTIAQAEAEADGTTALPLHVPVCALQD
jgi:hypothetical protein